jgi:hypothetical protein
MLMTLSSQLAASAQFFEERAIALCGRSKRSIAGGLAKEHGPRKYYRVFVFRWGKS